MTPRGLLTLVVCSLPALSSPQTTQTSQADDVNNLAVNQCHSAALSKGLTEWQNQLASHTRVQWGYGNMTCSSLNRCFGLELNEDVSLEPQILPVQIQHGMQVRFYASPNMDVPFNIQVYLVDLIGFQKCDVSRGQPITDEPRSSEFAVPNQFLSVGSNYFIANTTDLLYECRFGLRLNVTVRTEDCSAVGETNYCFNRGRCVANSIQPQYTCSCCHGYTGRYCEDIDACASDPCLNGGTCSDIAGGTTGLAFRCQCTMGFHGDWCEKRVADLCEVSPCANNASCSGNDGNYTCICPRGYSGSHCEVDINNCEATPCKNGVCVDELGGHKCYCTPGYGGVNCDREFNECQSNPCRNNGFCIDVQDGFQCHCGRGYTGEDCSIKIDLCNPSPCENSRECVDYGQDFACTCDPGYSGTHCEININECASNPCMNDGKCRDTAAGYTCICPETVSGSHCEYRRLDLPRRPLVPEYHTSTMKKLHINNLYIVAGTLSGALLIALAVLAGCYCRVHETYRRLYCKNDGYNRQHNDILRNKRELSARQVAGHITESRPSMDAILEASQVGFDDSSLESPLVNSLKPKRV